MQIKLKPLSLAIVIVVLMFGGITFSGVLNYWKTESSKIPAKYTSGEYEGTYNPADIRGSYSFLDINENFDIPLEHLAKAFGLKESENAEEFLCKDLESRYAASAEKGFEIGTDSVRVFVALYKGLPIELADTYIPVSAYQVLKDNVSLTQEQIDYLDAHTVDLSMLEALKPAEVPTPIEQKAPVTNDTVISENAGESQKESSKTNEEENSEDSQIKGKTTFRELLDWGITGEEIEQIIGKGMPNVTLSIRDFCVQQGIEFSAIKTELQNILDKK